MTLHYDVAGFLHFISLFYRDKQRKETTDGIMGLSVYPPAIMRTNKNKACFQMINKITLKPKGIHLLDTVTVSEANNGAAYFSSHIEIEFLLESY